MKRAQYRDAPPQNIYSHIDHKWGYDGSGLRVEQSFRREFATIIPLGGCDAQAIQAIRQATGFTPRVE